MWIGPYGNIYGRRQIDGALRKRKYEWFMTHANDLFYRRHRFPAELISLRGLVLFPFSLEPAHG